MENTKKLASVVVPAYNEEEGISGLLEALKALDLFEKYEFIIVDDGSTDQTAIVAKRYPVKVIRHSVNKGYGASLKTGVRRATTPLVITMDSDGQHDPAYIDTIVEMLEEFDMVIGERSATSFQVKSRKSGKWLIRKTGEMLVGQKLPDYNSGLRGFHRDQIYNILHLMPNGFSFSTTSTLAYLKEGYNIGTFPIQVVERVGRASSVKFVRDGSKTFLLLFRIIMLFNPLKVFFPASIFFTLAGLAWGVNGYLFFGRFSNSGIVLITLGISMFFFGLLADQISLLNRKK
jgi:glycosyltransferase involved in cell wall biosynthesis